MKKFTQYIIEELQHNGAELVGVGSLLELPEDVRAGLPVGISVAVKYPKEVIEGITELPTQEYKDWYDALNERLDALVTFGAELLTHEGYTAIAQSRAYVGNAEEKLQSLLPQKTVATRSGLGWIGKCALLVTSEYGSMLRFSSILTDAPLTLSEPINASRCGRCTKCRDACPARAVSGKEWSVGMYRDEFFDPVKCRTTARERSLRGFGQEVSLCGKCIEICPYTQRYIREAHAE